MDTESYGSKGIFIFREIFLIVVSYCNTNDTLHFHLIYVITRDDLPTKFLSLSDIPLTSL